MSSGRRPSSSKNKSDKSEKENVVSAHKCSSCQKILNETAKSIKCDICNQWICLGCSNVTQEQYEVLSNLDGFHYSCFNCKSIKTNFSLLNEKLDRLTSTIETSISAKLKDFEQNLLKIIDQKIESKFKECEDRLKERLEIELGHLEKKQLETNSKIESWSDVVKKSIQPDVQQLKNQVEDMKSQTTSIAESPKDIVNATIEKIEDRNNRRRNFIIFNLPENESKHSDDKSSLKEICDICVSPSTNDGISSYHRLGKKSDKGRPLLVKLNDETLKRSLFKNLGNLKKSEKFKILRVAHDMSQEERAEDKLRLDEAKKLNELSKNFVHKVRGPPWDRQIVKIPKPSTS